MKVELLKYLECPSCWGALSLDGNFKSGNTVDEIDEGSLQCVGCGAAFPIVRSLPRFVSNDDYAASF